MLGGLMNIATATFLLGAAYNCREQPSAIALACFAAGLYFATGTHRMIAARKAGGK